MAEIQLANGKGIALIDDEDVGRVPLTGWCAHPMGYAQHRGRNAAGRHTHVLLHRLVMCARRGEELDHINHDKLDCRKANLRFVTHSQNGQNLPGAKRGNKTGVLGVIRYLTKSGERYRAGVQLNGTHSYKWGCKTLEEASALVIQMRRDVFTHSPENRT